MMQQCETCTRRNIPPDAVRCPACGSVDLLGYDPAPDLQAEMLQALKRAAPWLGKMIADGGHQNAVLPRDCERTLEMVEAVIRKAEVEADAGAVPAGRVRGYEYDPADDGGDGEDQARAERTGYEQVLREIDERGKRP